MTRVVGLTVAAAVSLCASVASAQHPLDTLEPGHWYEVPSSQVSEVFPDPEPIGNSGPGSVIGAWGGAAWCGSRRTANYGAAAGRSSAERAAATT